MAANSIPICYTNTTNKCRKHDVVVYAKNYSTTVNSDACYVAWQVLRGQGETKIHYSEEISVGAFYNCSSDNVLYGPKKAELGTRWKVVSPSADAQSELKQGECGSGLPLAC